MRSAAPARLAIGFGDFLTSGPAIGCFWPQPGFPSVAVGAAAARVTTTPPFRRCSFVRLQREVLSLISLIVLAVCRALAVLAGAVWRAFGTPRWLPRNVPRNVPMPLLGTFSRRYLLQDRFVSRTMSLL